MALSQHAYFGILVTVLGILAFILGVIAENKKPEMGTAIPGKGVVICKYPSDPTVALGALSFFSLLLASILGFISIFFPYHGKKIPASGLFRSATLSSFFVIAVATTALAEILMLWTTIDEALHLSNNVHTDLSYACPTAKTGVFGGAAFLSLDATLFWLVCLMLTLNARTDYEEDEDPKGEYGQVTSENYPSESMTLASRPPPKV